MYSDAAATRLIVPTVNRGTGTVRTHSNTSRPPALTISRGVSPKKPGTHASTNADTATRCAVVAAR